MIRRLVLAAVVAVVTTLGCMLVGAILAAIAVPIAATIGGFLSTWAGAFGILAGLWFFFAGGISVPAP